MWHYIIGCWQLNPGDALGLWGTVLNGKIMDIKYSIIYVIERIDISEGKMSIGFES